MQGNACAVLIAAALIVACSQHEQDLTEHENNVVIKEIVSVYDADTFRASLRDWPEYLGADVGIRVRGVDAPEIRGKCKREKSQAKQARDYVRDLLAEARSVTLTNVETDKYFRLVADVYIDGENLSNTLIAKGLARTYDGGKRAGWC